MINSYFVLRAANGENLKCVGVSHLGWDTYGEETIGFEGDFPFAGEINKLPGKELEIVERQNDQVWARIEVGEPVSKEAYNLVPARPDDQNAITLNATFKCRIIRCDFFLTDDDNLKAPGQKFGQ